MGVGAAHDPGVELAGQVEIVGIFALAAHQGVVFLAADRLADAVFLHCDGVVDRTAGVILHVKSIKRPIIARFGAIFALRRTFQIPQRCRNDNV